MNWARTALIWRWKHIYSQVGPPVRFVHDVSSPNEAKHVLREWFGMEEPERTVGAPIETWEEWAAWDIEGELLEEYLKCVRITRRWLHITRRWLQEWEDVGGLTWPLDGAGGL